MKELWYAHPAVRWDEALPLGNGRLGAMVFGGALIERISMNEDSLWYGGFRDRVNPDARENLPRIRQLLREDRIQEATQLAEEALTSVPNGERHYEPLCDVILQQLDGTPPACLHGLRGLFKQDMARFDVPTTHYRRSLDIDTGIARTEYEMREKTCSRECFVSYRAHHGYDRADRGRGRFLGAGVPMRGRWRADDGQHHPLSGTMRNLSGCGYHVL